MAKAIMTDTDKVSETARYENMSTGDIISFSMNDIKI